jgi:hypothetical protein
MKKKYKFYLHTNCNPSVILTVLLSYCLTVCLTVCLLLSTFVYGQSPYIHQVFEYKPAPGQYVNDLPKYVKGDTYEDILLKAEKAITGKPQGLITLGAYGGYVVFGFDHLVENKPGKYDFKIWGNAHYSNPLIFAGSCEPGIVMVSYDANGNGLPDDPWYELAGSEYHKPETIKNYEITYYQPDTNKIPTPNPTFPFLIDTSYIKWTDNQGDFGYVAKNASHKQHYYPQWVNDEILVFEGNKLADNGVNEDGTGVLFLQYAYSWGYADNHPNDNIRSNFDIGWAVDEYGKKVDLSGIHFVKIYTGVNQYCGLWGETSTEIMGAEDFHIQGIDIDVLDVQTEAFPNSRVYYSKNKLHLENLEEASCTIFNITGQVMNLFHVASSNDIFEMNLLSGIYLLKIQKHNKTKTFKFIIY